MFPPTGDLLDQWTSWGPQQQQQQQLKLPRSLVVVVVAEQQFRNSAVDHFIHKMCMARHEGAPSHTHTLAHPTGNRFIHTHRLSVVGWSGNSHTSAHAVLIQQPPACSIASIAPTTNEVINSCILCRFHLLLLYLYLLLLLSCSWYRCYPNRPPAIRRFLNGNWFRQFHCPLPLRGDVVVDIGAYVIIFILTWSPAAAHPVNVRKNTHKSTKCKKRVKKKKKKQNRQARNAGNFFFCRAAAQADRLVRYWEGDRDSDREKERERQRVLGDSQLKCESCCSGYLAFKSALEKRNKWPNPSEPQPEQSPVWPFQHPRTAKEAATATEAGGRKKKKNCGQQK